MYEIYSDIDITFKKNLKTGDVNRKRNLDSVRQSIDLLLRTNFYERKWHPEIGSTFPKTLFKQADNVTLTTLKNTITNLLKNYEPRIILNYVNVYQKDEMSVSAGEITIEINYTVINLGTDTFIFVVDRTR